MFAYLLFLYAAMGNMWNRPFDVTTKRNYEDVAFKGKRKREIEKEDAERGMRYWE